jgi:hypothetical protein
MNWKEDLDLRADLSTHQFCKELWERAPQAPAKPPSRFALWTAGLFLVVVMTMAAFLCGLGIWYAINVITKFK